MKLTCEKYLLQSAVAVSTRAAASKSPIPTLEGILLEAGEDLRVTGYDLKRAYIRISKRRCQSPALSYSTPSFSARW